MQVRKQQLELDMEKQTVFKLGKEYVKAVYCHPAYLNYMWSTSCEMLVWMNHKLESRLPEEVSTASDIQMIPHNGRKQRGTKSLLMKLKEENEKASLKLNIQKTRILASGPITL